VIHLADGAPRSLLRPQGPADPGAVRASPAGGGGRRPGPAGPGRGPARCSGPSIRSRCGAGATVAGAGRSTGPRLVVTHPLGGRHPDHDAAARPGRQRGFKQGREMPLAHSTRPVGVDPTRLPSDGRRAPTARPAARPLPPGRPRGGRAPAPREAVRPARAPRPRTPPKEGPRRRATPRPRRCRPRSGRDGERSGWSSQPGKDPAPRPGPACAPVVRPFPAAGRAYLDASRGQGSARRIGLARSWQKG